MKMTPQQGIRFAVLVVTIAAVSLLHYFTPTTHIWWHPLLQRAYYIPILLMALLFGLRGGIFAASLSGLLYVPHIAMSWASEPQYRAAQFIEIGMFFVIGSLTGVLADHERVQRRKVEETARKLSEVYAQLQSSFEQLRRVDRLSALGELFATKHNQIAGTQYRVEASIHGGKDEIDHPLPVIRQRIL